MKLLIAIPALNEEQSIRSTIERCLEARGTILKNWPVTDVEITVVTDVAQALLRDASRLVSTPTKPSVGMRADAAGTSACATSARR